MKIGFVTENESDTNSLRTLQLKINYDGFDFIHLNKGYNGSSIETEKATENIKFEFEQQNPCIVIVVRDYDSRSKGIRYKDWFDKLNPDLNNKGLFLQIIYELETLILADIEAFNKVFGTKLKQRTKVTKETDPKGYLKKATTKPNDQYSESDAPYVFEYIDHKKVLQIPYMQNFITELNKRIKTDCCE